MAGARGLPDEVWEELNAAAARARSCAEALSSAKVHDKNAAEVLRLMRVADEAEYKLRRYERWLRHGSRKR